MLKCHSGTWHTYLDPFKTTQGYLIGEQWLADERRERLYLLATENVVAHSKGLKSECRFSFSR